MGKEQDLYVSTEHGLIGLKVLPGAIFDSRGMLKIEDESSLTNLSDIWRIVDETITPEMLVDFHPPLDFHGALDDTFLLLSPTSSAPGRPRVNKVSVLHKGEIQLDISSPGGDYNAIATFDDQTLNLKKLILDGKQVFPK
ncbi:hypothetical protein [Pedosphaera parvula]|uniref:hypothetical protein n=1 Tax=Pedosphaera parvula TaxID=1032527 RepID=UPI0012376A3C|nr:hypothetical protein [Pedosphaera parvula]